MGKIALKVDDVSIRFNLSKEKVDNLSIFSPSVDKPYLLLV